MTMAKFKVGDKVRSIEPVGCKQVIGALGEIVEIDTSGHHQPFLVKFDRFIDGINDNSWWCIPCEIELVKENDMFTKKDLKSGDLVMRRNGDVCMVCVESNLLMHKTTGGYKLSNINDDLTFNHSCLRDYDIVAVRRCDNPECWSFNAFEHHKGTLVYERKEVEEMTLEEVCKALGKEIKIVKK